MSQHWEIDKKDKSCVCLKLDEDNTIEVKKTDEGVIFEVWNNIKNEFTHSSYWFYDELIDHQDMAICDSCQKQDRIEHLSFCVVCGNTYCDNCETENTIQCTNCEEWFCNNCYNTELGDGCYCHNNFARKHSHDMDNGAYPK
jgi:hypothetical protein